MIKLYPIVFKFGEIQEEVITDATKTKYLEIARANLPSSSIEWASLNGSNKDFLFFTLPIYKQTSQEASDNINTLFFKRLEDIGLLKKGHLINSSFLLLIDIRGIDRDQQTYYLSIALNQLLESQPKQPKVILIIDKQPLENDTLFKKIFALNESKQLILINNTNSIVSAAKTDPRQHIRNKVNGIFNSDFNQETLSGKLIKFVGHFKIDKNINVCSKYFYDGRYCNAEIRKLTIEFILEQKFKVEDLEYIFYTANNSPWLRESLSALSGDIEADFKDYFINFKGAYNVDRITQDIVQKYKGGYVLLILDIINKGNTFKKAIDTINSKFQLHNNKKVIHLSILNNNKDSDGNLRTIYFNSEEIKVPFFINVELNEDPSNDCSLCKLGIPHNNYEEEHFLRFKSYVFWSLADQYEYEQERVTPMYQGRKRMLVPNFVKWVEDNAPYLAYKFHKFIIDTNINSSLNFAIVYPDEIRNEHGNRFNVKDSASFKFASKLKEIFNVSTIGIPRNIIDGVKNKTIRHQDINHLNDNWRKAIQGIPPKTDIVILDEFHKGGGTFESIHSILEWLGKPARCYFAIADFNPNKEAYNSNIPIYNLYEFNYPNSES